MLPPPAPISTNSMTGGADRVAAAGRRRRPRPGCAWVPTSKSLVTRAKHRAPRPDLGGRAAHVERDDRRQPSDASHVGGRHDAGRRTGFDHEDGPRRGRRQAHRVPPLLCMTSGSASKPSASRSSPIEDRYRSTIGRTAAFTTVVLARKVLPDLGRDVGRRRDEHPGMCSVKDPRRRSLMVGIGIRVEQADRDGLDAGCRPGGRHVADTGFVKRNDDLAGGPAARAPRKGKVAGAPAAAASRTAGRRAPVASGARSRACRETMRRHERGLGGLALDNRVRRDGAPVDDQPDIVGLRPASATTRAAFMKPTAALGSMESLRSATRR